MTSDTGNAPRLDLSPLHLLHRAGQRADDVFNAEIGSLELTPRQFAVLATVASAEGLSQTDLVERTGIDRSTLADIVARMLKKGLLQRRRTKDDARGYAVRLTEEGQRLLHIAKPLVETVDRRLLDSVPAIHRQQFLQALALLVEVLGQPRALVVKPR